MNIQHLRAVRELSRQHFQVSRAAAALGRAQPGVSRQIIEVETELGVQLFRRNKNRIQGLTAAGRDMLPVIEGVLSGIDAAMAIAAEHRADGAGQLVVATTHTHAHYSLPRVIEKFSRAHPKVKLALRQGNPLQCREAVASGTADLAISTEVSPPPRGLVTIPAYRVVWDMIAKAGHPVLRQQPLTLEKIVRYPLITHDSAFSGRQVITEAFARVHATPHVVLDGADADVSKAYVARGFGIAILAKVAFHPRHDRGLRLLRVAHLLRPSTLCISMRDDIYLRDYVAHFVSLYAPHLEPDLLRAVLQKRLDPASLADTAPRLE